MKIYLEREDKEVNLEFEGTVFELLKKLKVNHNTVVVDINGVIAEYEDKIFNGDSVRVLDVVTGG